MSNNKSKLENFIDNVIEYKTDNPSVALQNKIKPFKQISIQLKKGVRLYMLTDGLIDQFGGKEGKKFSSNCI